MWSKFEFIRDVIDVLLTSKNKEEPNKNEGASVVTSLNIDFSNTQGQITPRSEVGSGQNSNSSKMLRMPLLLRRTKEEPNKNGNARVATTLNIDFSHSQGQITLQSRIGSG